MVQFRGPDPAKYPELHGFADYNEYIGSLVFCYLGIKGMLVELSAYAETANLRPVCRNRGYIAFRWCLRGDYNEPEAA